MKKYITPILMTILLSVAFVNAQDSTDVGTWNDLLFTKSVSKKVDVSFGAKIETRHGVTQIQENRYYGGVGYKFKNGWSVQGNYIFIGIAGRRGWFWEHRPTFTVTKRIATKNWSFAPRVRQEYRFRPAANSYGFVPGVLIERKINKEYKAFFNTEMFFDTRKADPRQYRKRFFFGVNKVLNKNLNVDIFYMYQKDEKFNPINSHRIGFTWKVKL